MKRLPALRLTLQVVFAVFCGSLASADEKPAITQPNIVLILADDHPQTKTFEAVIAKRSGITAAPHRDVEVALIAGLLRIQEWAECFDS